VGGQVIRGVVVIIPGEEEHFASGGPPAVTCSSTFSPSVPARKAVALRNIFKGQAMPTTWKPPNIAGLGRILGQRPYQETALQIVFDTRLFIMDI
jgi:hypothetical protein